MVYDANQPMLRALCGLAGAEVRDCGVWPDDRDAVKQRLAELAPSVDVILTSGGASMGDEDHMSAALAELGKRHFWQIAVKPGRPLMLGQIGQTVVVGLPGNPVAVFVCFLIYVWPMLAALSGAGWREAARMPARTVFDFGKRKPGRREYWRGTYHYGAEGVSVDKFRRDGSGLISGLRAANCLIEIPETAGDIEVGTVVQVIPFPEFGIR
jgi:molybdopterin molybdotransferase